MKNNRIFTLAISIFLVLLFTAGGYLIIQKRFNISNKKITESSLPSYLFLTNPVSEFTGKIDKISGETIWISGKYTITPPPTPPNAPTVKPGSLITVPPLPPSKTFTYQVAIAPYTVINRASTAVTYLIKKITPLPTPKLSIQDFKTGQIITVYTQEDLRTLNSNEFEAYAVKLPPINNKITGKILEVKAKEGIIILKAIPPVPAGSQEPTPEKPKELEYAISVNSDTEISILSPTMAPKAKTTPKPPQPVNFSITDLKKDIQITVITGTDVTESQQLKALRIEPPVDLIPTSGPKPT